MLSSEMTNEEQRWLLRQKQREAAFLLFYRLLGILMISTVALGAYFYGIIGKSALFLVGLTLTAISNYKFSQRVMPVTENDPAQEIIPTDPSNTRVLTWQNRLPVAVNSTIEVNRDVCEIAKPIRPYRPIGG